MPNFEIEHKFLIKKPSEETLLSLPNIRVLNISQTYTTLGARARKTQENGKITYVKTVKKHVTDLVRIEKEEEITEAEYNKMLTLKFKDSITLNKTRYVYPYKNKKIEIDIFPFWQNQAFLEVELETEDEEFSLPPFVEVIKEITGDKAYRNYALSKKIPKEEIF
ncbi:MAG: hypothetical protein IIX54_01205 [Clostridia bacterium]|nr:hypothetical protein [Clostridia bacterium]